MVSENRKEVEQNTRHYDRFKIASTANTFEALSWALGVQVKEAGQLADGHSADNLHSQDWWTFKESKATFEKKDTA